MIRRLCIAALLTCGVATAQAPVASQLPCANAESVAFQSVSIQTSKSSKERGEGYTPEGFSMQGGSLGNLLEFAFFTSRVDGLPDWAADDRFDVTALINPDDYCRWYPMSAAKQALALQAVLRDRFHMQWHYETRQLPGFALVVAKGGPKFKAADPSKPCPDCILDAGIKTLIQVPYPERFKGLRLGILSGHIVSMKDLAEFLSLAVGTPVVDQTGLTGIYRLETWGNVCCGPRDPMQADGSLASMDSRSVVDELKPQLGLDLKYPAKVPVDFFIIDHIEEPSEK